MIYDCRGQWRCDDDVICLRDFDDMMTLLDSVKCIVSRVLVVLFENDIYQFMHSDV